MTADGVFKDMADTTTILNEGLVASLVRMLLLRETKEFDCPCQTRL